jgi:hypothetical protein
MGSALTRNIGISTIAILGLLLLLWLLGGGSAAAQPLQPQYRLTWLAVTPTPQGPLADAVGERS